MGLLHDDPLAKRLENAGAVAIALAALLIWSSILNYQTTNKFF